MSENSSLPEVSVVICSYSEDRWDRLIGALDSVRTQTFPPKQTIVVVDYNVDLYKRLIFTVPDAVIIENAGPKGLSGARNTGAGIAKAEIVAFLDDDAEAEPDWLERLAAMYDDPDVLAVGGRVEPLWEAGRPGYFANELDWIVGCTYRGMPKVAAEVRNVIGANMSFRASVLERVGGFNTTLGRQDAVPLGCEETELCIRAVIGAPGSRVVYEPAALVHHHVPAERGTLRYMLARSWGEGISKAQVSRVVGHKRALGPERRYVRQVLPRAVFAGIRGWLGGGDRAGLGRAAAIIAVLAATATGYVRGRRLPAAPSPAKAAVVTPEEPWREVK